MRPRSPRFPRQWREAEVQGRPVFTTGEPTSEALAGGRLVLVWDSGWRKLWRVERLAGAP